MRLILCSLICALLSNVSFAYDDSRLESRDRCIVALKKFVNASHTFRVKSEHIKGNEYYFELTTRIFVVTHKWNGRCVFRADGALMKSELI